MHNKNDIRQTDGKYLIVTGSCLAERIYDLAAWLNIPAWLK